MEVKMRSVAYALIASGALTIGALTPASAGCDGDCDDGYRSSRPSYERYERYSERPAYRDSYSERPTYYERPRYHTTYYERPAHRTSYYDGGYNGGYRGDYYERPAHRTSYYDGGYDGGYYERPYYQRHYNHHSYGRPYGYGYNYGRGYGDSNYGYGSYYPTVRYGGAWSQTGPAYASWGGCHSAYIPYGWTWYRASSC
jgi:hypothetical protein